MSYLFTSLILIVVGSFFAGFLAAMAFFLLKIKKAHLKTMKISNELKNYSSVRVDSGTLYEKSGIVTGRIEILSELI